MNWNEYQTTNTHESFRLEEVEQNYNKKLDKAIMVLTFIVTIAYIIFKERV